MTMLLLVLLLSSSCPETDIINKTNTWTTQDQRNLKFATNRCIKKYEDAPCLKKFYKIGTRRYWALCGCEE
jgi:hypothetical protein